MFDATTIQVLGATLLVTLVALLSSSLLMLGERSLRVWIPRLVALAVGVLLGDAFLHLIPDAIEVSGSSGGEVMIWTLIGIVSFLFLENVLNWRHQHDIPPPREDSIEVASFAKLNLAGDGVHNFVDGVLIASSFLVDPRSALLPPSRLFCTKYRKRSQISQYSCMGAIHESKPSSSTPPAPPFVSSVRFQRC